MSNKALSKRTRTKRINKMVNRRTKKTKKEKVNKTQSKTFQN